MPQSRRMCRRCTFLTAVTLFGCGLVSAWGQAVPTFNSDVKLVNVDVQVTERGTGRVVDGLRKEDFEIRDNDEVRPLATFDSAQLPLDLILVTELTGEIGRNPGADFFKGLASIVDALHHGDRIGVVSFDDKTSEIRTPLTDDGERAETVLLNVLAERGKLKKGQGNALVDALADAAKLFGPRTAQPRRRAVLVLTHNRAKVDTTRRERVITDLLEANATVMGLVVPAIAIKRDRTPRFGTVFGPQTRPTPPVIISEKGSPFPPGGPRGSGPPNLHDDEHAVDAVVEATGGEMRHPPYATSVSWSETMERLRLRYMTGFYVPDNIKAGEIRHIQVRLTGKAAMSCTDCIVRGRSRYRVP